jgi:bifunctional glutamyl/prolyl-tRNA synthetase
MAVGSVDPCLKVKLIDVFIQSVGRARPVVLISSPDGTPGSYGPPNKPAEAVVVAASGGKKKAEPKKPVAKPAPKQADTTDKENKKPSSTNDLESISTQIKLQGDKVRALKEAKADKATIGAEVKILQDLKASYKAAAGKDWQPEPTKTAAPASATPSVAVPAVAAQAASTSGDVANIQAKITNQGDLVRKLKAEKAAKADVDEAVKGLLALKQEFKSATGQDWKPAQPAAPKASSAADSVSKAAVPDKKAKTPPVSGNGGGFQGMI